MLGLLGGQLLQQNWHLKKLRSCETLNVLLESSIVAKICVLLSKITWKVSTIINACLA